MKCSKCGATISDTANFCTECGMPVQKQNEESIQNQEIQSDNSKENGQKGDIQENKPLESESNSEQPQNEVGQRVCPNCGEKLREGARFCVGCGMPIQQNVESTPKQDVQSDDSKSNATIGSTQETKQSNPPQESYVIYEQPQKNKTLKVFIRAVASIAAGIVVLYVCLAGYALFKSVFSTSEGEETSLVEAKSYVSQDLKFFDLKGNVKECTINNNLGTLRGYTSLKYSPEGEIIELYNGDLFYVMERDEKGRISRIHKTLNESDLEYDEMTFTYDSENQVSNESRISMYCPMSIDYIYENNTLVSVMRRWHYDDGTSYESSEKVNYKEFDEYGNWVLCEVSNECVESGYDSNGNIVEKNRTMGIDIITRKITYYSQNSKGKNSIDTEYKSSVRQETPNAKSDMASFYRTNFSKIKELLGEHDFKNKTQYALKDLDGDGNNEFFITDADVWYTSVFTVKNEDIKAVTRNEGLINSVFGKLLIYGVPGSTWGAILYCLLDNGNVIEGMTGTADDGDKFYLNDKECSKEEFEQFFSKYKGKEELLEWKPLSSLIGDIE